MDARMIGYQQQQQQQALPPPPRLLAALAALSWLGLTAMPASAPSVWSANPFEWHTVQDKLYTFCSNHTGALSTDALAKIGLGKMMIHGMEEGAGLPPAWAAGSSEAKVGLAAKQLRAVAPKQLQLYTVQIDFPRWIYDSGQWFNHHSECLLHDANGSVVIGVQGNNKTGLPNEEPCRECCFGADPSAGNWGHCPVFGFDSKCGQEAWVKLIVDTVESQQLDGVFIDGFQGCDPFDNGCRVLGTASPATATAWVAGLKAALFALAAALGRGKTIICNQTGKTYYCDGEAECFCTASNDERFGGGPPGAVALMDYNKANPQGGVIVHVPHINGDLAKFNTAFSAFLLGAYNGTGFGIGFGYECDSGGWLELEKFPTTQKLGAPLGDTKIANAAWADPKGGNCTFLTPARPRTAQWSGCLMSRGFSSGLVVFVGQHLEPNNCPDATGRCRPTNGGECIWWSDGTLTGNASTCPPKESLGWEEGLQTVS